MSGCKFRLQKHNLRCQKANEAKETPVYTNAQDPAFPSETPVTIQKPS